MLKIPPDEAPVHVDVQSNIAYCSVGETAVYETPIATAVDVQSTANEAYGHVHAYDTVT